MPVDPNSYEDSEEDESDPARRFYEFDCPLCNANNPYGDGFIEGDEIRCFYCGQDFKVEVSSMGRLKLFEL